MSRFFGNLMVGALEKALGGSLGPYPDDPSLVYLSSSVCDAYAATADMDPNVVPGMVMNYAVRGGRGDPKSEEVKGFVIGPKEVMLPDPGGWNVSYGDSLSYEAPDIVDNTDFVSLVLPHGVSYFSVFGVIFCAPRSAGPFGIILPFKYLKHVNINVPHGLSAMVGWIRIGVKSLEYDLCFSQLPGELLTHVLVYNGGYSGTSRQVVYPDNARSYLFDVLSDTQTIIHFVGTYFACGSLIVRRTQPVRVVVCINISAERAPLVVVVGEDTDVVECFARVSGVITAYEADRILPVVTSRL